MSLNLSNLIRHLVIWGICTIIVVGASNLIHNNSIGYQLFGWLLCWIVLDIYGWLKYELLPNNPIAKRVYRAIAATTKVRVEGWEEKDLEYDLNEKTGVNTITHKPSGTKIVIQHPTQIQLK